MTYWLNTSPSHEGGNAMVDLMQDLRSVHMVTSLRHPNRWKIFLFIIRFNAIMHRTTIVQNKIINIICSCLFFCPLIFIGLV